MKRIFTFLIILLATLSLSAQVKYETLFDFENGVDTLWWVPIANGTGTTKDLDVVINPLQDNVNSSDSVLWMHIYTGAESWVGYYTDLDKLYNDFNFAIDQIYLSDVSHILALMVNKPVVSPSRIKLERSTTGASPSTFTVADTNTVVNEWELLEYDFTAMIGNGWQRLTIFPESTSKANRTEEVDVYLDNIGVQTDSNTSIKEFEGANMKLYPNPAEFRMAVVYPGLTGVRISNINGQEIRTMRFGPANSKVVEVGDLTAGMYFVTAITEKGNHTMQFLKK
jgi:hypothetical protein